MRSGTRVPCSILVAAAALDISSDTQRMAARPL